MTDAAPLKWTGVVQHLTAGAERLQKARISIWWDWPSCAACSRQCASSISLHSQIIYLLQQLASQKMRSLKHYLWATSQGHHTIDHLEERCVERGSTIQSSLTGWKRATVSHINIGTVSKMWHCGNFWDGLFWAHKYHFAWTICTQRQICAVAISSVILMGDSTMITSCTWLCLNQEGKQKSEWQILLAWAWHGASTSA